MSHENLTNGWILDENRTLDEHLRQQQYDMPLWGSVLLWLCAAAFSLVTIVGNALVVMAYRLDRSIRKQVNNRYIVSLALSDLIIGIEGFPLFTVYVTNGERWTMGALVCQTWLVLDYSLCLVSILTVLLITIDRFLSVCYTAVYLKWQSPTKVQYMIVASWLVPSGLFGLMIYGWQLMAGETTEAHKCYAPFLKNPYVNMAMYLSYYWTTLAAMLILYRGIHHAARDLESKGVAREKRNVGMLMMQRFGAQVGVTLTLNCQPSQISATELPPAEVSAFSRKRSSVSALTTTLAVPTRDSGYGTQSAVDHFLPPPPIPEAIVEEEAFLSPPSNSEDQSPSLTLQMPPPATTNFDEGRGALQKSDYQSAKQHDEKENASVVSGFTDQSFSSMVHISGSSERRRASDLSLLDESSASMATCRDAVPFDDVLVRSDSSSYATADMGQAAGDDDSDRTPRPSRPQLLAPPSDEPLDSGSENATPRADELQLDQQQERRVSAVSLRGRSMSNPQLTAAVGRSAEPNNEAPAAERRHGKPRLVRTFTLQAMRATLRRMRDGWPADEKPPAAARRRLLKRNSTKTTTITSSPPPPTNRLDEAGERCSSSSSSSSSYRSGALKHLKAMREDLDSLQEIEDLPCEKAADAGVHQHERKLTVPTIEVDPSTSTKPAQETTRRRSRATYHEDQVKIKGDEEERQRRATAASAMMDLGIATTPKLKRHYRARRGGAAEGESAAAAGYWPTASDRTQRMFQAIFSPIEMLRKRRKRSRAERRARKAFRTITFIVGLFALLWSPYYVVATVYGFCPDCVPPLVFVVSYYLCYINSTGNPFAYAMANRQFRAAFLRMLRGDFRYT